MTGTLFKTKVTMENGTSFKTKVIMDNGTVYLFTEQIDQFLERVFDPKTSRIIPMLLEGENFYINTEHIASLEEVGNSQRGKKLSIVEKNLLEFELKKLIDEDME